jgi:hypothetical protein
VKLRETFIEYHWKPFIFKEKNTNNPFKTWDSFKKHIEELEDFELDPLKVDLGSLIESNLDQ